MELTKILLPPLAATIIFLIGEYIRRRKHDSNETSRKLVHSLHGLVLILWYLWVGADLVILAESVFFGFMFIVRFLADRYPSRAWMYSVGRLSWGEFFYPVGIIAAAWLTDTSWFFVVAVAQLALADSAAALAGQRWGRLNRYKVFRQTKSLIGTTAFFLTASAIAAIVLLPTQTMDNSVIVMSIIFAPVLLAALENASPYGSDNLTLPIASVLLLNYIF